MNTRRKGMLTIGRDLCRGWVGYRVSHKIPMRSPLCRSDPLHRIYGTWPQGPSQCCLTSDPSLPLLHIGYIIPHNAGCRHSERPFHDATFLGLGCSCMERECGGFGCRGHGLGDEWCPSPECSPVEASLTRGCVAWRPSLANNPGRHSPLYRGKTNSTVIPRDYGPPYFFRMGCRPDTAVMPRVRSRAPTAPAEDSPSPSF